MPAEPENDMALENYRTKILCTVGPAIKSADKLEEVIRAGGNAFRLNFSHGSHAMHKESIERIRLVEKKLGIAIPIIADVQGPKIRVGDLKKDVVSLINGREVMLAHDEHWKRMGSPEEVIPVQYRTIAKDVAKGDELLFDDGLLKVKVLETQDNIVRGLVAVGGLLKSRKGINLPNVGISQPSLTEKDKADIEFAVEHGCDYIAISFVRTANDIIAAKTLIRELRGTQNVIAKIEKPEALVNIKAIIDVSDAIMIARGDLGVEIPASKVPTVQKEIIKLCNERAMPVITATQMLESMVQNHRPTRAEASDVANAVLDGTDVVMLSAETSVGAFPIETVAYMRRICTEAENLFASSEERHATTILAENLHEQDALTNSVARAVVAISEEVAIKGIAVLTYTSRTVRFVAHRRPDIPIIAITLQSAIARKVNLLRGVHSMVMKQLSSTDEAVEAIKTTLVRDRLFASGSQVVITVGRPLQQLARTNMISIETLP